MVETQISQLRSFLTSTIQSCLFVLWPYHFQHHVVESGSSHEFQLAPWYWVRHDWVFCNPMDCNRPGSSVHGILQARILEWVVISFSRGASPSRDEAQVSCIEAGCFTILAIRESPPSKEAWVKSMDYHNGSQKWGHKMWIEYSKSSSFNYIEYRWALISETSWNFWPKKYSTIQWLFSYVAKLWSCFSDRNR